MSNTRTRSYELLTEAVSKEEQDELLLTLEVCHNPFGKPLAEVQEAYQRMGRWYAISKDMKRRAHADEKLDAQFREDLFEAYVKGLDRAIMAIMALMKTGG